MVGRPNFKLGGEDEEARSSPNRKVKKIGKCCRNRGAKKRGRLIRQTGNCRMGPDFQSLIPMNLMQHKI